MDKNEKMRLDFLSALKMGRDTFEIFESKIFTRNMSHRMTEALKIFSNHILQLEGLLDKQGYKSSCGLKKTQELALKMEEWKIRAKDDFELCLEMLHSIQMGIKKGLTFLHKHSSELDDEFLSLGDSIIKDYGLLFSYFLDETIQTI